MTGSLTLEQSEGIKVIMDMGGYVEKLQDPLIETTLATVVQVFGADPGARRVITAIDVLAVELILLCHKLLQTVDGDTMDDKELAAFSALTAINASSIARLCDHDHH